MKPADRSGVETLLSATARRRVVAVRLADGGRCVRKRFLPRSLGRRAREALKGVLGMAAWQREARALTALRCVPGLAPELRGERSLGFGARELELGFVEGESLVPILRDAKRRRPLMSAIGHRLRAAHAAGWVHLDLHEGNVLVAPGGPVLIDWQRARRRATRASARAKDIARFEHSLWLHGVPQGDRMRFRRAALGLPAAPGHDDAAQQAALRAVGHAVAERARAFRRVRTRRAGRPGDGRVRVRLPEGRGLRCHSLLADELVEALAAHRRLVDAAPAPITGPIGRWLPREGERVLKCDHRAAITAVRVGARSVVVKEVRKGGPRRRLADAFRGTPAFRGWRAGHGLALRDVATARPLAFVERRVLGWPLRSWLVQEDLRGLWPVSESWHALALDGHAHDQRPASGDQLEALVRLLVRLHRGHVRHGDLQALHVLMRPRSHGGLEAVLIDCDSVRFEAAPSDADRVRDLAQLNASLPDDFASAQPRRDAFEAYARRLPFAAPPETVLREVARASRARAQHWTGAGCACAAPRGQAPRAPGADQGVA